MKVKRMWWWLIHIIIEESGIE